MSPVRTLSRDQLQWRVYEVSTLTVPGAPSPCCLIFDSDAIVRRCWTYPSNWATLDDGTLWELLTNALTERPVTPLSAAAQATADVLATSRSLTSETALLRDANRALREQRDTLLRSCHESRDALLEAVGQYATTLKRSAVPPELTIVLVKDAIRDGLGGAARAEEPEGVTIMGDGVAHAIKAYYAA